LFSPVRSAVGVRRRIAVVGAIGFGVVLTATLVTGTATAGQTSSKENPIPLGQGYMGVGYLQDAKDFKPDTRTVQPAVEGVFGANLTAYPVGVDVSHYQGSINWKTVQSRHIQFAWIKATEGTSYRDPKFNSNYTNAYKAKVIRGAYHFARPDLSGGDAQAKYFAAHGGAWSKDNLTLPGVLDLEGSCYGKSQSAMRSWISTFHKTYKDKTGRNVVVYTSKSWWDKCTGKWAGMKNRNSPLWVAHWTKASKPSIPGGYGTWTVWQYSDSGQVKGISGKVDVDRFNGTRTQLLKLANNG